MEKGGQNRTYVPQVSEISPSQTWVSYISNCLHLTPSYTINSVGRLSQVTLKYSNCFHCAMLPPPTVIHGQGESNKQEFSISSICIYICTYVQMSLNLRKTRVEDYRYICVYCLDIINLFQIMLTFFNFVFGFLQGGASSSPSWALFSQAFLHSSPWST